MTKKHNGPMFEVSNGADKEELLGYCWPNPIFLVDKSDKDTIEFLNRIYPTAILVRKIDD